jgi:uncharacterized protein (TIGR02231 family)
VRPGYNHYVIPNNQRYILFAKNKLQQKDIALNMKNEEARDAMEFSVGSAISAQVGLSAGVLNTGGGYSIRGARSNERQIRVDGLDVGNQFAGAEGQFGTGNMPQANSSQYRRTDAYRAMTADTIMQSGGQSIGMGEANYFSFEYSPDEKYTIETDKKPSSVILNEKEVKCEYAHIAQPRVASEAFLVAKVGDWSGMRLLPGSANVYMANSYIGKSFVDIGRAKDTLLMSIGRVRGVATERTKMEEYTEDKFFGSNVVRKVGYRLKVVNNKPETITVALQEPVPVSTTENIKIELLETSGANFNKEKGLLEWQMELKPGESKVVIYVYEMDMPQGTYIE